MGKSATDNGERIAAVNHWRGRCLDNFAKVEQAIIRCSEALLEHATTRPFKLEESAGNRTRKLGEALIKNWPQKPESKVLAALLDHWSIREKERNDLVHGCFVIGPGADSDWLLVNKLVVVKKGIAQSARSTLDARQADAFLQSIISERKRLETALRDFASAV